MVRVVGLEPTLPKKPDFESGASTNSATPAFDDRDDRIILLICVTENYNPLNYVCI